VTLQNNGGDNLVLSANGPFTFATALSDGAGYTVTVLTQPSGQTCNVSSGTGNISGANVTTVQVACVDEQPPEPPPTPGADSRPIPTWSGYALVLTVLGLMFAARRRLNR
jgi:hypothetical protein